MTVVDPPGETTGDGEWIDSHCHLQDTYRPGGVGVLQAVEQAAAAGVAGLVCVGTDAETSRQAVLLVDEVRTAAGAAAVGGVPAGFGAWATVGLHPHEASEGMGLVEPVLEEALADHRGVVVAVGECGLDYHYDHSPRSDQREMFAAQIALAARLNLTLVVHTRDAWDDTLDILKSTDRPPHIVMHCFTGGPDEARRCLDLDAFLSFSGIVSFKNATDVRAAASLCPLDRLLVETDAPFLAPVPHRGEDNRPALVPVVGAAVAAIKGMSPAELATSSRASTYAAFALPPDRLT
jgi:TatD DNase family protein